MNKNSLFYDEILSQLFVYFRSVVCLLFKLVVYFILQIEPIRTSDGGWKCPFCPKIMNYGFMIRKHIKTHTGEKPFVCKYCNYSAIQKHHLKNHYQNKHGIDINLVF